MHVILRAEQARACLVLRTGIILLLLQGAHTAQPQPNGLIWAGSTVYHTICCM